MSNNVRILILEDTASDAALMEDELLSSGLSFVSYIISNREDYLSGHE